MPVMTTPTREVLCDDAQNTALWVPMTPAIATADIKQFRVRMWFAGLPGQTINVEPALQFSADGFTWGTVQAIVATKSFTATDGWVFDAFFEAFMDLFGPAMSPTYTGQTLFVRFGANFKNTTDDNPVSLQARLRLETLPVASAVLTAPQVLVYSDGTTNKLFQAVTDWMPSCQVVEARVSFEVLAVAASGDLRVAGGYQIANNPTGSVDDGEPIGEWGTTTTYGGDFTPIDQTKSYVRLGLFAKNLSSSDLNVGSVAVRIEYRD